MQAPIITDEEVERLQAYADQNGIQPVTPVQPVIQPQTDQNIADLANLQDQARNNAENIGYVQALNTIAQGIAGGKPNQEVFENQKAITNQAVRDYLLRKQKERQDQENQQKDTAFNNQQTEFNQSQSDYSSFRDPNSKLAVAARKVMKKLGYDVDPNTSLYDLKRQGVDPFKMLEDRQENWLKFKVSKEKEPDMRDYIVPGVGEAMTKEDAKVLKDAAQQKAKFDSQIQEMIDLREKYGSEVMNREAVQRGKQLSKDLLLTYKNMAKLGVLSKSDEDIVNAIIPADPLEITPSKILGQDPVATRLKSFKRDLSEDYENTLSLRLNKRYAPAQKIEKRAAAETKIINGAVYQKTEKGWAKK